MSTQPNFSEGLEFKYPKDDAWYNIELALQQETLVLKYSDFPDEFNEKLTPHDFKSIKELDDFIHNRFRPTSLQLQDEECEKVVEGMTVSASFKFGPDDVRFYDAVVLHKDSKGHRIVQGYELCACKFQLFWLDGPNTGKKTVTKIEHMCLLQDGDVRTDPTLSLFLKMCMEKLNIANDDSAAYNKFGDSTFEEKPRPSHGEGESHVPSQKKKRRCKKCAGWSTNHRERTEQDIDLGGISDLPEDLREASPFYYILIDNLEKDVHPSAIVDFISEHVSVSSRMQLFPSLSLESYARGVIVANSEDELQRIVDFLQDPSHIIVSSRGRPWVITEKRLRRGAPGETIGKLTTLSETQPRDTELDVGEEIKLFSRGTTEYNKGKQLRELFLNFADDSRRLHHLYAMEESKILQAPQ